MQLRGSYQDQNCLYMLMDWVPGGELFHYIDVHHSFDEPTARFFAANVVLTMEHLHAKGIVYRDLKPENLVLEASGYLKLADFGFAKHVGSGKAFTICGTPDYQAPEVIMRRGATRCVDFWAIGVLIYEMLVGEPPFMSASGDPWDTFRRAMTGRCHVPRHVSKAAGDLIYKLLQVRGGPRHVPRCATMHAQRVRSAHAACRSTPSSGWAWEGFTRSSNTLGLQRSTGRRWKRGS